MKIVSWKLVSLGAFIVGSFSFAAKEVKPLIQSHTLRKDVIGSALLQGVGKAELTGTVEFQKKATDVLALSTIANGEKNQSYAVRLVDTQQCPKEVSAIPSVFADLGKVSATQNGMGTSEKRIPTSIVQDQQTEKIAMRAVMVTPSDSADVLACGIVHVTNQQAE